MRGQLYHLGDNSNLVYYIGSLTINSVLTLLTAGRIWWIHRQAHVCSSHTTSGDKLVQSVCRIILESGILYPLFQIANAIGNNNGDPSTIPFDFLPLAALMAGITPTLIMVHAKLGENVESLQMGETTFSTLQFGNRHGTTTTTTTGTAHVQSHNIALSEIAVVAPGEEGKTSA
ncbi:hypothetical protein VKT23_020186 [Stygiomarasmius scandens]|uniref:Uncharacterized protein n=1 Tax=Marasmiellus scandens TaxID=2682957 RepID=A0ABR1IKV0_9AGAR